MIHADRSRDRGAPLIAVIESTGELFSEHRGVAEAAAERIREALADSPLTILATLDRALRDGRRHRQLGCDFVSLDASQLGRADRLRPEDRRLALLLACSLRSGYTRADALRRLGTGFDPWVAGAAIVRLTDFVPAIAEDAWRILKAHMRPNKAAIFVRTLPLLDRLEGWTRATRALAEIRQLLTGPSLLCEAALWDGARSEVPGLRLPACRLLRERIGEDPRLGEVYALALADASPVTRRWAAESIAARGASLELRRRFLPQLSRDRSPAIRTVAVRLWDREEQGTPHLVAAAFDVNAGVRHHARVALASRRSSVDYRGRALATLEGTATKAALIGALATLSDFGRRPDLPRVEAFCEDPRARVAKQARRTAELLAALP